MKLTYRLGSCFSCLCRVCVFCDFVCVACELCVHFLTLVFAGVTAANLHLVPLQSCKLGSKQPLMVLSTPDIQNFSLTLIMLCQNTQLSFQPTSDLSVLSIGSSVCSLSLDNIHVRDRSEPLIHGYRSLNSQSGLLLSGSHYHQVLWFYFFT